MTKSCVSLNILEERFPQLYFLLQLSRDKPWTFCNGRKNGFRLGEFLYKENEIEKEIASVFSKIDLDKIEVLYIYGIGLGHYGAALLDWLAQDVKRDLVFLEDDIEVVRLFSQTELSESLMKHPQIHFRFLLDPKQWKKFLEEQASEFSYENIELIALKLYQQKDPHHIARMRLHLMRRTTVHHAIHMDGKFYHVLSKNVLSNFPRIHTAFYANCFQNSFEQKPAIICGAGPSLKSELETLRKLDNQAVIFAGGSAIAGLSHAGILPHFSVAIDPNFEEVERFQRSYAFEVPLLYTNRVHPLIFDTFNGPHGYIHAMTGGPIEQWWEEQLGIEPLPLKEGFDIEALSVTTTCLGLATTMGCNPIILVGVDLAFTNDNLYAPGIIKNSAISIDERKKEIRASEQLLKRKDRYGNSIYTLVKWVMESETIGCFIKKNRKTTYINSTSGGIGFPGLSYQPLSKQIFTQSFDIRGKIHQLIEQNRFASVAKAPLNEVIESLQTAKTLISKALEELKQIKGKEGDPENGKLIFFQMEIEALLAYPLCLQQIEQTFLKTFNRSNRFSLWDASKKEKERFKWNYLYSKWNSFNDLIIYYLDSSFTK